MRALLQGMLVVLHFWTFSLFPTLHAGYEAYQLEIGIFDDDKNIPKESRKSLDSLTFEQVQHAQGYYLSVFSLSSDPHNEDPLPTFLFHLPFYKKDLLENLDQNRLLKETSSSLFKKAFAPFNQYGDLSLTLSSTFQGKLEIVSPFSVLISILDGQQPKGRLHSFQFLGASLDSSSPDVPETVPYRHLTFQQKELQDKSSALEIGSQDSSAAWKKIKWDSTGVVENTAPFLSQTLKVKTHGLINKASLSAVKTKVETCFLNNQNGEIKGSDKTQVIVQNHLDNRDGMIGSDTGETHLKLAPTFNQINEGHELGNIQGSQIHLHGNGFQEVLRQGSLKSKERIHLSNSLPMVLEGVHLETPLLELDTPEFRSDKIPDTKEIRFWLGDYENVQLHLPYLTKKELKKAVFTHLIRNIIFWQKDMDSAHHAKDIVKNPPHVLEPRDTSGKTIQVFTPLQTSNVFAYAPDYKLHIKHPGTDKVGIHVENGLLRAYVRAFDLEEGSVIAKNAEVFAQSIRIGELFADFTRNCLKEFYPGGDNIHQYAKILLYTFIFRLRFEETIYKSMSPPSWSVHNVNQINFQDHSYLNWLNSFDSSAKWNDYLSLPLMASNGATFSVSQKTEFQGILAHRGVLKTHDFSLFSKGESITTCGEINVSGNMELKDGTRLYLIPAVGDLCILPIYTTPTCNYTQFRTSALKCGASSKLDIQGALITDTTSQIINIGSTFHAHVLQHPKEKNPIQDFPLYTQGFQPSSNKNHPLVEKPLELSPQDQPFHSFWKLGTPANINCRTFYDILYRLTLGSGAFVPLWSQNHSFSANSSTETYRFLSPTEEQVINSITAPLLVITYPPHQDLQLGVRAVSPQRPQPHQYVVSLANTSHNLHLVEITNPKITDVVPNNFKPRYDFVIKPKYSYNKSEANDFYKKNHHQVVVLNSQGEFTKPSAQALFTLSPQILLETVRNKCHDTLKRPYFEISFKPEENKITLETLSQLHQNMVEYLGEQKDYTLFPTDKNQWPSRKKPALFYESFVDDNGDTQLTPYLLFPQEMVKKANGAQNGSNINGRMMMILPQGVSVEKFLAICQYQPKVFKAIQNLLETNPTVAEEVFKALPSSSEENLALENTPTTDLIPLPQTLDRLETVGDVHVSGNINMDISCFLSLGGLYSDAYLRGDIAFGVANKKVSMSSLKEIQGFYENGWWGTQEVITALADWKLTNTLGFISPEITLTGAQAYGEIESLFFQNHFLVQPLPLYTSAQRHTSGDNWSKREYMSSTRQVQSRVHGGFLKIDSRSSTTIISAILSGQAAEIPINAPLEMLDSFDTYSYTAFEESKKKQWHGGTRKTSSSHHFSRLTPVPTRLDFQEIIQLPMSGSHPVLMRSVQAENSVMEFIMDMTSVQENNPPQITLGASYTEEQSSSQQTSSGFFRTTSEMERRLVRNYVGCQFKELKITILNNPLNIKPFLNIQTGSGQIVPGYVTSLQHQEDIALIHTIIQNIYQHEHKRHSALSGPFKMVLAMAVSALIPGLGTSLGMVMLKAGLTCMGTNAVVSLGEQGNLRGMTSRENLRGLATTVATAGLSHMIAEKLNFMAPKGEANILTETPFCLAQNVVKSVIQSTLQTTIERNGKFGDNLVRGLKTAAIETGNVLLTRQIGRWVHQDIQVKKPGEKQTQEKKEVNPILHRAAHFTVGAGTGYLLKANPWMAGANQVVGEEIGTFFRHKLEKQELNLSTDKIIDVIKFITSVGTFLSGGDTHDICASTMTSGNAAQHNAFLNPKLTYEQEKRRQEQLESVANILEENENSLLKLYLSSKYNLDHQTKIFDARRYGNVPILQKTYGQSRYLGSTIFDHYIPDFCRYIGSSLAYNVDMGLSFLNIPSVVSHYMGDVFSTTGNLAGYVFGDPITYVPIGGVIGSGLGKTGAFTSNFLNKFETYQVVKEFTIQSIRGLKKPFKVLNSKNVIFDPKLPSLSTTLMPSTPLRLTGPSQVRLNYASGRSFQQSVHEYLRVPENYKRYEVMLGNKKIVTTIPDLPIIQGITDIKNVKNISMTEQLQAQIMLAKNQGTSFNLIISPNTQSISKSIWENIVGNSGGKVFEFNPQTEKMIERIVKNGKVVRN